MARLSELRREQYGNTLPIVGQYGGFQVGGPLGGNAGLLDRIYDVIPGVGDYRGLQRLLDAAQPQITPNLMGGASVGVRDPGAVAMEGAGLLPVVGDIATAAKVGGATLAGLVPLMARNTDQLSPLAKALRGQLGGVGALPNPLTQKAANQALREQKWRELEQAVANAGQKRSPTTGRYVGAGPDITSPQKKTAQVTKYMNRTQAAIDAGIPPGYFYEQGAKALSEITDSPEAHRRLAEIIGPTSTQVGPSENLNYALRAADQAEMGVPTNVGLYPNSLRRSVDAGLYDEEPWTGYKVERYSTNLNSPEVAARTHPLQQMPPNDQWEGYGTGLARGQVPAGPTQVAFSDHIRELAMNRLNEKRVAKGLPRLTRSEMQELHWAAIRAEAEGRPLQLNPGDTIQGSIPGRTMQHSWEAEPGATAAHSRGGVDAQEYADAVYDVIADEQGKDRLVRALGGNYQLPIVRGPGVYKGETSPGFQSRSLVSHTAAHGLDDASAQRVDTTEAVRQLALAQDARATSIFTKAKRKSDVDTIQASLGRVPTEGEAVKISGMLEKEFGDSAGFVFTDDGYRILNLGMDNKQFAEKIDSLAPALKGIVPGDFTAGARLGSYAEYDWAGGNATKEMLGVIDNPQYPGSARLADSAETRQLMGEMGDLYEQLRAKGMEPNQKLINVLKAWKTDGLAGVRSLVEKGLAPAFALGVFAGLRPSQGEPEA